MLRRRPRESALDERRHRTALQLPTSSLELLGLLQLPAVGSVAATPTTTNAAINRQRAMCVCVCACARQRPFNSGLTGDSMRGGWSECTGPAVMR